MTPEFTAEAHLCDNGVTSDGWPCTGSVHAGSVLVRCTDESHRVSGYITTMPERPVDWPAVAARLAGKLGEAQAVARHWQGAAGRLDRDLENAIAERRALPREMPVEFAQAVIYHRRRTEGEDGCTECGPLSVGSSFAEHLWTVYRTYRIPPEREETT